MAADGVSRRLLAVTEVDSDKLEELCGSLAEVEASEARTTELLHSTILRHKEQQERELEEGSGGGGGAPYRIQRLFGSAPREAQPQAMAELRAEIRDRDFQLSAQSQELASTRSQLEEQAATAAHVRRQLRDLEMALEEQQLAAKREREVFEAEARAAAHRTVALAVAEAASAAASPTSASPDAAHASAGGYRSEGGADTEGGAAALPAAAAADPAAAAAAAAAAPPPPPPPISPGQGRRAAAERDVALATQLLLSTELSKAEDRAKGAEGQVTALQAEVETLTAQLQAAILERKKVTETVGASPSRGLGVFGLGVLVKTPKSAAQPAHGAAAPGTGTPK